jgi:FKBP-type peptidyl-prolyl cis-trans isomerase 2
MKIFEKDVKMKIFEKEVKMKKILVILAATILLFSGCVGQKTGNQNTVKIGDNVSVDYTGSINGRIFDTSIESIAKENNLSTPNKTYEPLLFTVGKGQVIKGLDEGIIGMKVEESKTLIIPPDKAYGPKNPLLIKTVPVIQEVPIVRTFSKVFEISADQFSSIFGVGHKVGDSVKVPSTNANITILNISTISVSVSYELSVGSNISSGVPWNDTVIKVDDKNITVKSEAKKNDTFQFGGVPWNTTVTNIDSANMTIMHNKMPDTKIQGGLTRIHFNDTYITMDQNGELVGETLVFNVTIKSIN